MGRCITQGCCISCIPSHTITAPSVIIYQSPSMYAACVSAAFMVSQVHKSAPLRCVADYDYPVTGSGELSWAAAPHKDATQGCCIPSLSRCMQHASRRRLWCLKSTSRLHCADYGYPVTGSGELSWAAAPHKDATQGCCIPLHLTTILTATTY